MVADLEDALEEADATVWHLRREQAKNKDSLAYAQAKREQDEREIISLRGAIARADIAEANAQHAQAFLSARRDEALLRRKYFSIHDEEASTDGL